MDARCLLEAALRRNVAFVPGDAFFADEEEGRRYMRLNFSCAPPEVIREGIGRLASAIRDQSPH
jgi:DNA-binding transcriptional MocR family regulator